MSRQLFHRPDSTIEVRHRDGVPEQFLWRGKLYRVREVLERWSESGAWWEAAPARGEVYRDGRATLVLEPIAASPKWAQRAWGEPAPDLGAASGPMSLAAEEREFWRVEAGSGALTGCGVYDLCLDVARGQWSLSAVLD